MEIYLIPFALVLAISQFSKHLLYNKSIFFSLQHDRKLCL